jgi:hypothetical protein
LFHHYKKTNVTSLTHVVSYTLIFGDVGAFFFFFSFEKNKVGKRYLGIMNFGRFETGLFGVWAWAS